MAALATAGLIRNLIGRRRMRIEPGEGERAAPAELRQTRAGARDLEPAILIQEDA